MSRVRRLCAVVCFVLSAVLLVALIVDVTSPASSGVLYLCKDATGDACTLEAAGPFALRWVRALADVAGSVLLAVVGIGVVVRRPRLGRASPAADTV